MNGSGAMFDQIAPVYDWLNRLLSLGMDTSWRRRLVASLELANWPASARLLDVATGTADVPLIAAGRAKHIKIIGIDPSEQMLVLGRDKIHRYRFDQQIALTTGAAEQLPYPDHYFHGITCSFGLRNMKERLSCLREMVRVCSLGGTVAVLEFNDPVDWPWTVLSRFYLRTVVPWLGALWSRKSQYRYLQQSIADFASPTMVCSWFYQVGLTEVRYQSMGFGTVGLYCGRKLT